MKTTGTEMNLKILVGMTAALLVTACGSSSHDTTDQPEQAATANDAQADNVKTTAMVDNGPSFMQRSVWLNAHWGLTGYARCAPHLIHATAEIPEDDVLKQRAKGYIQDYLNATVKMVLQQYDEPILENAVSANQDILEGEPAVVYNQILGQCLSDIQAAQKLTAADFAFSPEPVAEVRKPATSMIPQQSGSESPAPAPDPVPATQPGAQAVALNGRWAADGEECGAATNFVFATDSYTHGTRSGAYTFDGSRLAMAATTGNSIGDVTSAGADRIVINWKAWKPVNYSRCST